MCVIRLAPQALTIALVGAHGVGKTTLGRALAAELGAVFHDEVGRRLAHAQRPAGQTAADPQETLDEAIFAAERERDEAWCGTAPGSLRVVETWHPGNLAYAARRSPAVVDRHLAHLCALGPAVVLPIRVPPDVACARQSEPCDPAFFRLVGEDAEAWAHRLGLPVLPPVDNDGPLALSVRAAVARLTPLFSLEHP